MSDTDLNRDDVLDLVYGLIDTAAEYADKGDRKRADQFLTIAASAMALADRFPGGVLVSSTVVGPQGPVH